MVLVLGDVGEVREVAEGADDADRLPDRQGGDDCLQRLARRIIGIAVEPERGLADLLDEIEGLAAVLSANRLAQDAAQQTDVVAERRVLVVGVEG